MLFREARHIFLREVDHELLGHGVGETRTEELALLVLRFACHRQQPVIEVRLVPCLECLCPFVRLRHGIGGNRGKIDHHAAIGQSRIERLDHIDRTGRVDFNDVFRCRVAWRNAGGMDDLRHVTERCSITKAFPFNTKHAACKVRKQRVFLLLYAAPVGEDMLLKVPGILTLSAEVRTMIENAVFSQDGGAGRCGI